MFSASAPQLLSLRVTLLRHDYAFFRYAAADTIAYARAAAIDDAMTPTPISHADFCRHVCADAAAFHAQWFYAAAAPAPRCFRRRCRFASASGRFCRF